MFSKRWCVLVKHVLVYVGVCFIARINHDRVKVKFVRRSRVQRYKASALIKRMREYRFFNIYD